MNDKKKDPQKVARAEDAKREHDSWQVKICNAKLDRQIKTIQNPEQTGHQILKLVNAEPSEDFMMVRSLKNGTLELLPLDKTIDLRNQGDVECFIFFEKKHTYKMILDQHERDWNMPVISGLMLKRLAEGDPAELKVWHEAGGSYDPSVDDSELVCLDPEEPKRFFTGKPDNTEG